MIFDDVGCEKPVFNEYFCRGRQSNSNMIYLKQNIFLADRQNVRENCNLFIFFDERGRATTAIYHDFFSRVELSYDDFSSICENAGLSLIVTLSLIKLKIEILNKHRNIEIY